MTSDYEGYGRTVVEAAAAGLPVIMTDVGISVGKATPVGDKKALVESLKEMISNPAGRKILVDKQSEFFKHWPAKEEYLVKLKEEWQKCCS